MKFENEKLELEYNTNWEEVKDNIPECILILNNKNKKSRIMLMEHENQAVNLDYLKSAVELFPRDDKLKIEKSEIINLANINMHKLLARNNEKNLKTITISLIHKTDVYIFNYISFNLDNDENSLDDIVNTVKFKKTN